MRIVYLLVVTLVLSWAAEAAAQGPLRRMLRRLRPAQAIYQPATTQANVVAYQTPAGQSWTTQARANRMANSHDLRHFGGQFSPGATREGWGYSTVSAQDAIRRACYYGRRPIVSQSVAKGPRGWYAVLHYR